jgi:hypothetical protein
MGEEVRGRNNLIKRRGEGVDILQMKFIRISISDMIR